MTVAVDQPRFERRDNALGLGVAAPRLSWRTTASDPGWTQSGYDVEVRRGGSWKNQLDPAAVTLARRESEFENDMATGSVTALLVLSDVRVGDVVRVSYTIEGENPILQGLVDNEFFFGWRSPNLDRRARVLFPPGATPTVHATASGSTLR